MGWLSHKMTTNLRQEWLNTYKSSNKCELLDYSFTNFNKQCWSLWKNKETGHKFINVTLIDCHVYEGIKQIGFKDMDTSVHPFYYDCPVKFLKQINHDNQGSYHIKWLINWAIHKVNKNGANLKIDNKKLDEVLGIL